jgi:hypothetical protein
MRSPILLVAFVATGLAAQTPPAPTWAVAATPTLLIGDESDERLQFLRVGSVARFSDGSIVVANGATQELRLFTAKGEYVRSLSRRGSGPGELNTLRSFFRSADTIIVSENGSVHLFTPKGFLSKLVLRGSGRGSMSALGRFPDGRLLLAPSSITSPQVPAGRISIDSLPLAVAAPVEAPAEWIATFPRSELLFYERPSAPGRPAPVPFSFGHYLGHTLSGDRVWVGDSRTGVIAQYNSAGKRVAELKFPIAARPFESSAIQREKSRLLAEATSPDARARTEALYDAPRPPKAPLFTKFVPGVGGEVWVRMYDEDSQAPGRFVILDRAGRLIGQVTMPANFRLSDPGADYVLGVLTDGDGVERVAQFRLTRR